MPTTHGLSRFHYFTVYFRDLNEIKIMIFLLQFTLFLKSHHILVEQCFNILESFGRESFLTKIYPG